MDNITVSDKKALLQAMERGEKLMIFRVSADGAPLSPLAELRYTPQKKRRPNKYVDNAIEYIEENYYKDIRLGDLADACGVSPSHLCRLFSAATGSTVNNYILATRMNRAAYLLVNTDESVVNIAREVGCPDCGYFHKRFRAFFGVTPVTYRKQALFANE